MNVLNTATVKQYNIKPRLSNVEGGLTSTRASILTWLEGEVQNLVDSGDVLVFWSVENDDQRSEQA